MKAVEALLYGAIDYAGLFPPAALDLEAMVRNYEGYRAGPDAWALGRLVLPAGKLAEFSDRWPQYCAEWPISLLLGEDYELEMRLGIDAGLRLAAVECRPARLQDVAAIRRRMPEDGKLFVEGPPVVPALEAIRAIADAGACAKLRTGGLTADAIPETSHVAAFLACCARCGLCLKATAGLHHAIRGEYRLTYAADSPSARMHGFVNFFLAAAAAYEGADKAQVDAMLDDDDRSSFNVTEGQLRWRQESFSVETIQKMRQQFAISFGSCSFEEPLQEMRTLGWIG